MLRRARRSVIRRFNAVPPILPSILKRQSRIPCPAARVQGWFLKMRLPAPFAFLSSPYTRSVPYRRWLPEFSHRHPPPMLPRYAQRFHSCQSHARPPRQHMPPPRHAAVAAGKALPPRRRYYGLSHAGASCYNTRQAMLDIFLFPDASARDISAISILLF